MRALADRGKEMSESRKRAPGRSAAALRRRKVPAGGRLLVELPPAGLDLNALLDAVENDLLDQALARTNGNKMRASALLGINRTTLIEKLRRRGSP